MNCTIEWLQSYSKSYHYKQSLQTPIVSLCRCAATQSLSQYQRDSSHEVVLLNHWTEIFWGSPRGFRLDVPVKLGQSSMSSMLRTYFMAPPSSRSSLGNHAASLFDQVMDDMQAWSCKVFSHGNASIFPRAMESQLEPREGSWPHDSLLIQHPYFLGPWAWI